MRMLKPNPGELVDRQSILELKIDHSNVEFEGEKTEFQTGEGKKRSRVMQRTVVNKEALGTKVHLFFDELELIQKHLIENWLPDIYNDDAKIEEYNKLFDELSDTNSQLWDLEDQIRILKSAPDPFQETAAKSAATVAFTIVDMNDKRAMLVKKFNALWGIQSQEKLY